MQQLLQKYFFSNVNLLWACDIMITVFKKLNEATFNSQLHSFVSNYI